MRTLLAGFPKVFLSVFLSVFAWVFLVASLGGGCLDLGPPPGLPTALHIVSVTVQGALPEAVQGEALDRVGRAPTFRIRFDRPIEPPDPDAVLLVTGDVSATLRTDAAHAPLPAAISARRVAATLSYLPSDPTSLTLRTTAVLLPDTPLVLLVTPRVRGHESVFLTDGDGGTRTLAYALTVAPARLCGPVATMAPSQGAVPRSPGRVLVRFDRPVHVARSVGEVGFTVAGRDVPTRWSLDCLLPDGFARCAWFEPANPWTEDTVAAVRLDGLTGHNNLPVENHPEVLFRGAALPTPTPGGALGGASAVLGPTPGCLPGETPRGHFCLRVGAGWATVRATTVAPSVLRANAVPADDGPAGQRAAVSAGAVLHALRVEGMRTGVAYMVSVTGALDPVPAMTWWVGLVITTAPTLPVRITEIVFRPHGLAAQAYVELVNEGSAPANVGGWSLVMGPKRVDLPAGATVAPHGRSVVTGTGFDPRGFPAHGDPALATGAGWITVAGSLAAHGLRATGAAVALEDAAGTLVSFVPGGDPGRVIRPGVGLVRAELDLPDDDPAAWTWDAAGGCTPGAPDRLR